MKSLIHILTLFLLLGFKSVTIEPTPQFLEAVKRMETKNWIHDHDRLSKVSIYPEIDRNKRAQFEGFNFYPIDYAQSAIFKMDISPKMDKVKGKKALSQVRSIWAYFYRKEPQEKWNSDGLIEQWEFDDEQSAKTAYEELDKIALFVYFNTQPYYFAHENFLYIFHTRAMAFSFEQKSVFEMFKSLMTK